VEPFSRYQGKAFRQVEPELPPENRKRAGPCAIAFTIAFVDDFLHQIKILLHAAFFFNLQLNT
jgi:hypothetical protein